MKFLRAFSCHNVDSEAVISPSSTYRRVGFSEDEYERRAMGGSAEMLCPDEIRLAYSPTEDLTEEESSLDSASNPLVGVSSRVDDIFRSKPKGKQELISNNINRQNSRASNTSTASLDWGYPGHLSEEEYDVYVKFHNEASQRGDDYQKAILCFGKEESEEYALCRWLRARKFDLSKATKMVEDAMKFRAEAAKEDFFPNGSKALGVEKSIYYAMYPEVLVGYTKNGFPFYVTKAADAAVNMLNCITTPKGITNFHWHSMMHVLGDKLRRKALSDPSFKRFEVVIILDLEGITVATATEALPILKGFIAIDQLCFPECLNRFIFINAPPTFAAVWRIIKTLIDQHTASKVEILSARKIWQPMLLDLVGAEHLPSDYGGSAPTVAEKLEKLTHEKGLRRQVIHRIILRSSWSVANFDFVLTCDDDAMKLIVHTSTPRTGTFTVTKREATGDEVVQVVEVKHSVHGANGDDHPTIVAFPQVLDGPGNFQVRVSCSEGQGTWVLVGKVFDRKKALGLQKMSTVIMRSGERRYSNFDSAPIVEVQQAQIRRASLKELLTPVQMDKEQRNYSRWQGAIFPALAFLVVLLIHDYFFYHLVTSSQCRR